jgi:hypothetical protein
MARKKVGIEAPKQVTATRDRSQGIYIKQHELRDIEEKAAKTTAARRAAAEKGWATRRAKISARLAAAQPTELPAVQEGAGQQESPPASGSAQSPEESSDANLGDNDSSVEDHRPHKVRATGSSPRSSSTRTADVNDSRASQTGGNGNGELSVPAIREEEVEVGTGEENPRDDDLNGSIVHGSPGIDDDSDGLEPPKGSERYEPLATIAYQQYTDQDIQQWKSLHMMIRDYISLLIVCREEYSSFKGEYDVVLGDLRTRTLRVESLLGRRYSGIESFDRAVSALRQDIGEQAEEIKDILRAYQQARDKAEGLEGALWKCRQATARIRMKTEDILFWRMGRTLEDLEGLDMRGFPDAPFAQLELPPEERYKGARPASPMSSEGQRRYSGQSAERRWTSAQNDAAMRRQRARKRWIDADIEVHDFRWTQAEMERWRKEPPRQGQLV